MSDGRVEIDVELNIDNAESEANAVGKAVGSKFAEAATGEAAAVEKEIPREVDDAGKRAQSAASDGGKKSGDKFAGSMTQAAKSGLANFGTAVVGALGVGAVIDGAFSSVEVANEFAEDMGKLEVAFSQAGYSAETANGIYRDFVGILGETDQSVEAVNHLSKLTQSEEELAEWANIAAGVYATFGDSLPIEGLTEAANETARVGQVTGPLADALNWAGESEDEFNAKLAELATEEERASFITETLSGLYRDAGNAYMETNGAVVDYRQSQSDLNESMSNIGETLMPLISGFQDFASQLLDGVQPAAQWLVDNFPGIVDAFRTLAPLIVAAATAAAAFAIAINFSAIVGAASTALNAAKTAVLGLNAAMAANPIALVISLVAALVAGIVTLFATNEEFREAVIAIWEQVKVAAEQIWGAIVNFFTVTVPNAIQGLIDWFARIPENVANFLETAKARVSEFASNLAQKATEAGQNFFDNLVNKIAELPSRMLEIGGNIVRGIWDGIMNAKDWILGQIGGFVDNIVGGFESLLGINSPSTVMRDRVGRYMAEGVGVGFDKYSPMRSIEKSMLSDITSLGMSARLSYAGASTTNYYTIERIDAHDLAGVRAIEQLVDVFERNAR